MTTPSETRAGKLRDIAFAIMNTAESSDECADKVLVDRSLVGQLREALAASEPVEVEPVPMILHCPRCHVQHVDEPDERTPDWANPPHRSHLCHGCGYIWRPADVATVGVAAIKTKGKADSPAPEQPGKGEACERCGGIEIVAGPPCDVCGKTNITQLSDPAEGDALRALIADWRERAKNGPGALNVAAKELEAALSTPLPAAVRCDAIPTHDWEILSSEPSDYAPALVHGWKKCRTCGLQMHFTAEPPLTAALDPQVKR